MASHDVRVWPADFESMWSRRDRPQAVENRPPYWYHKGDHPRYEKGDDARFREFDPDRSQYTGREFRARVLGLYLNGITDNDFAVISRELDPSAGEIPIDLVANVRRVVGVAVEEDWFDSDEAEATVRGVVELLAIVREMIGQIDDWAHEDVIKRAEALLARVEPVKS